MTEQTAIFLRITPAADDPAFSTSVFMNIDVFDDDTDNEVLLRIEPQPGVQAGIGLEPPDDAGGSIPTTKPGQAWPIIRFAGTDHYIGENPYEGGLPNVQMSLAGVAWSFGVPSRVGDNGRPWTQWEADLRGLAPPGTDELDILFEYDFAGILFKLPVITGGRSWASGRPLLGNPLALTGKGRLSRHVRPQVSYLARINHQKTHGELTREILALTALDPDQIVIDASIGEPLIQRLEVDCSSAPDAAAKVMESYGYRLLEIRGEIAAKHSAPVDLEPVATIRVDRVVTGEVEVNTDWEPIPHCIRIEGERPIIPDFSDAWTTTEKVVSETVDFFTVSRAGWFQDSGGDINVVTGPSPVEIFQLIERIIVRESFFLGCLQITERFVWRFHNPEAWRYKTAVGTSDGLPFSGYRAFGFFFTESIPVKDDTAPVFQWVSPRFVVVEYTSEERFRDSEFATLPLPDPGQDLSMPIGKTGRLAKVHKGVGGWQAIEAAWRFDATSPPDWTVTNVISNTLTRGGGLPVLSDDVLWIGPAEPNGIVSDPGTTISPAGGMARWGVETVRPQWISSETTLISLLGIDGLEGTEYDADDGGWETLRVETNLGFERPFGDDFQYKDGTESSAASLFGRAILVLNRPFIADGGGTHTEIRSGVDGEGKPIPTVTTPGIAGHLPNADVCDEESEFERNVINIVGEACLPDGLVIPQWTDTIRFDFGVETAAQADRLAEIELRRLTAAEVPCSIPINVLLSVLDPIRLESVALGVDPDAYPHPSNAWIEELEHVDERDGQNVSRVTRLLLKWATAI